MRLRVSSELLVVGNELRHRIYGNSLLVSDDMKVLVGLLEQPIHFDELRDRIASPNLMEILQLLLDNGFIVDVDKPDYEQISTEFTVQRPFPNALFGAPAGYLAQDLTSDEAAIGFLGIPYDKGSPTHMGAREAAESLRRFSVQCSYLECDHQGKSRGWFDPRPKAWVFKGHSVRDYGNLPLTNNQTLDLSRIETIARKMARSRIFPVFIGGDHSITVPILRGLLTTYPAIQVVQFDAHSDLGFARWGVVEHGSFARSLMQAERIVRILQMGIRGPQDSGNPPSDKVCVKYMDDSSGISEALDPDVPTYLTIDLDVFDPRIFPGVSYPIPCGWSYEHFVGVLEQVLSRVRLVGMDWVEYVPHLDRSNNSVSAMGYAILDAIKLISEKMAFDVDDSAIRA